MAYVWQYMIHNPNATESDWLPAAITSRANVSMAGLTPGELYDFRFATVSSSGTTDFGPPFPHRVI